MTKKEKKELEIRKLVEMGANVPKPPKVPFNILMGMRRKQKERDEKLAREAKDGALLKQAMAKRSLPGMATMSHRRLTKTTKEKKKERERHLRPKVGKFKDGMLVLSKREIREVSRQKRPTASGGRKSGPGKAPAKRQRR